MSIMRIKLLLCAFMAFSIFVSAQDRNTQDRQGQRPKPETTAWWDQPIVKDLGLSEEQNKKIRTTVAESRDRLIQLRDAADKAEAALQEIMNEEKVDLRRGQEAIDRVVTTRGEMMRAVTQMSLKLRAILTSAQWQILQTPLPAANSKLLDPHGSFVLYVGNGSEISPVDIRVEIDGELVVSDYFSGGHLADTTYAHFALSLSKGKHRIHIWSEKGNADLTKEFEAKNNNIGVIEYIYNTNPRSYPTTPRHFNFYTRKHPLMAG
jgi:hypothetical protein